MAEIKIEKKKRVWPWILLALGIIGLLIYFLGFNDNNEPVNEVSKTSQPPVVEQTDPTDVKENQTPEPQAVEQTDLISVTENNSKVEAYVNFVEADKLEMDLDHEYTNAALLKLIQGTEAMAEEVDYDIQVALNQVNEYAQMITNDPFETTHANNLRKANDILANALQNIQKAKYPGLSNEVAELKNASESIKPGVLTLEQKDEVKTFFNKAAVLLQKMN